MSIRSIFRNVYLKAPTPTATDDQVEVLRAVISALATHIQKDGDRILSVKVPSYTGAGPDLRFCVSGIADFTIEVGLDVYDDNVVVEANPYRAGKAPVTSTDRTVGQALTTMVSGTPTASASVEASTAVDA